MLLRGPLVDANTTNKVLTIFKPDICSHTHNTNPLTRPHLPHYCPRNLGWPNAARSARTVARAEGGTRRRRSRPELAGRRGGPLPFAQGRVARANHAATSEPPHRCQCDEPGTTGLPSSGLTMCFDPRLRRLYALFSQISSALTPFSYRFRRPG